MSVATAVGVLDEPPEAMDFSLMFGAAASDVQQHPLRSPLRSSRPAPGPSIACALDGAHPVLLLKHGAPVPTVDFGDVAPKTTEKRILVLHNDSTRTQRVDLRPTSIDKRDALRVYPTSMELEPGGSREMEISWAPITAGAKMSKKLDFMWNGGSSALKVELRGVCAKSASVAAKVAPAISTVATKKAGGASASSAKPLAPVRDTNVIAAAPRVGPASAADLEAVRAPSAAKPWQAAREERASVAAAAADVVFAPARLLARLPTATPAAALPPASPAQADAEAVAAQDAESMLIDFGTGSPAVPLGASVDPLADALAAAADARSMILGIVSPPPPPADAAAEAEAAFLGANMERFNALRGALRAEDADDAFESARESLRSSPRPEESSRGEDESMRAEYESAEEDNGDHARALAQLASAAFAASPPKPPKPPPATPLGGEADADAGAPLEASASSRLLDFSSSFGAGASRAPRPFRPAAPVPQPAPSAPVPPPPSDAKAPNVTRRAVALSKPMTKPMSKPMSKPAIAPATVAEPTAVEPAATVVAEPPAAAEASGAGIVPGRPLKLSRKPALLAAAPAAAPAAATGAATGAALAPSASSGGADALGAYYDDNWREKRTTAYATWINFALTEQYLAPATDAAGAVAGEAAAGGAAMGGSSERQRMSLRELEVGLQQASLRAKMARLLRSPEVRMPLVRIEQQVQEDIIAVRPTLNLTADVGLRTHLLKLLDCYNPVWLRMGVEALIGETAPGGPADTAALRRFVDKRVLTAGKAPAPAWVAKEGTHFEEAAKKAAAHALGHQHRAIVRRVLALIWLLDHAKRARLLRADPCLFRPRLVVRSSRQLANEFSKHFLSGGIGDINRHLGTLGVKLLHEQTPLDEYDFTIAKGLGAELRDGVRLCKLVDLCTAQLVAAAAGEGGEGAVATAASEGGITALTLVPAENLSRKTHNARLALQRMAGCGLLAGLDGLEGDAARLGAELKARADLVVKGHTEATLDVLWGLISKGVMPRLAPTRSVQREVERAHKIAKRTHGAVVLPGAQYASAADADVSVRLNAWLAAVCAARGLRLLDVGRALQDGVALCLVLRHYLPAEALATAPSDACAAAPALPTDDELPALARASHAAALEGRSLSGASLRAAEERLAAVAAAVAALGCVPPLVGPTDAHGCGPDEHVSSLYLACLFGRLTQVGQQASAASALQGAWRNRHLHVNMRTMLRRALMAARVQQLWRAKRRAAYARFTLDARRAPTRPPLDQGGRRA